MKSECQNCCCKSLTNNASRSRHHRHQAAKIVDLRLLKTSRKISAVASFLGVSRKMLSKYTKGENLTRKVRKDKLSEEDIEKVRNFYLQDVSREKPNKRDVILMKGDNGEKNVGSKTHPRSYTAGNLMQDIYSVQTGNALSFVNV